MSGRMSFVRIGRGSWRLLNRGDVKNDIELIYNGFRQGGGCLGSCNGKAPCRAIFCIIIGISKSLYFLVGWMVVAIGSAVEQPLLYPSKSHYDSQAMHKLVIAFSRLFNNLLPSLPLDSCRI